MRPVYLSLEGNGEMIRIVFSTRWRARAVVGRRGDDLRLSLRGALVISRNRRTSSSAHLRAGAAVDYVLTGSARARAIDIFTLPRQERAPAIWPTDPQTASGRRERGYETRALKAGLGALVSSFWRQINRAGRSMQKCQSGKTVVNHIERTGGLINRDPQAGKYSGWLFRPMDRTQELTPA